VITPVNVNEFLSIQAPCFDVRSPLEFDGSSIIGAMNLPLLDNVQRKAIGTCYKHNGKEAAVALGYQLVNPTRHTFMETITNNTESKTVKLYCARGGLRSNKMAEFLNAHGYDIFLLRGGYKAYRNYILKTISSFNNVYILSGNTGCNKTGLLEALKVNGEQVIDLEALANHKGSAFGGIGEITQPSNAQFANRIFEAIKGYQTEKQLWVESESISIGKIAIPLELWTNMQKANGIEIVIPIQQRIQFIVDTYGQFDLVALTEGIRKLSKRLGLETTEALCQMTLNQQLHPVVERLLQYYDKGYEGGRLKKNCQNYVKFELESTHADTNCQLLLQHLQNL
jgi:tRNA 2-selenouridine synthase